MEFLFAVVVVFALVAFDAWHENRMIFPKKRHKTPKEIDAEGQRLFEKMLKETREDRQKER